MIKHWAKLFFTVYHICIEKFLHSWNSQNFCWGTNIFDPKCSKIISILSLSNESFVSNGQHQWKDNTWVTNKRGVGEKYKTNNYAIKAKEEVPNICNWMGNHHWTVRVRFDDEAFVLWAKKTKNVLMGKSHLLLHTGFYKKDSSNKKKVCSVANSKKFAILSVEIS